MIWYLLRGSIWETYTRYAGLHRVVSWLLILFFRPKLEAVAEKTSHAPLLGLFGALMKDWIPLIDEYYYCTSYALSLFPS